MNILISRTDSIGDVVLTLPMAGIIKSNYPTAKIFFLGKNYTRSIIELSEYVDVFLSYDDIQAMPYAKQVDYIKTLGISHCVHVFPKKEIALLMKRAAIPFRIGTTNRLFHWFTCNKLIKLSRKNSELHESQLNCKLLQGIGIGREIPLEEMSHYYGFRVPTQLPDSIEALLSKDKKNIILHPKSQGNGREWGLDNFGRLIKLLQQGNYKIFVSGTEKEKPLLQSLLDAYPSVVDLTGKMNLAQFIAFINQADALIAAGTGPLHVAAALNKCAIGLFPSVRPIHPGRWSPVGTNAHVVMMKEDCTKCAGKHNCVCESNTEAEEIWKILESVKK